MGQKFSTNRIRPDVAVFMTKYYPNNKIIRILNNGMLNNTLLIINNSNKSPMIAKIYFKHDYKDNDRLIYTEEFKYLESLQKKIFTEKNINITPIIKLKDDHIVGMIFRQYIPFNLKEKMYLMPYLTSIEKKFITFQLLFAVLNYNKLNIIHGDLKPENILLTTNLSVYICDFSSYKPAYINIDDISSYNYYFGSNDANSLKGCYLAPERLVENKEIKENKKEYKFDVFSLGVIIAELFLEENLFDFTSLLNYKKGNIEIFNIDEILNKIKEDKIKELIYKMIKINPDERFNIEDALNFFINEISPIALHGYLFHFNSLINSTKFWKPDLIIGHIYRYWIPVWNLIYGNKEKSPILYQRLNLKVANKIILEDPFYLVNSIKSLFTSDENNILYMDKFKLFFIPETKKLIENDIDKFITDTNKECILIIINYLVNAMKYVKYESSNLMALEMLKNISMKLDDISKLQKIIPYFIDNTRRKNYTTKYTTLNYIFDILFSINYNKLELPVTEYNYFSTYIFPIILKIYNPGNKTLVLDFFNNIDKIIDLQEKFLNITLKSRIEKLKNTNIKNKDQMSLIFQDYANDMENFKKIIFKTTRDLIGQVHNNDILISVIRQFKVLLNFFGRNESENFSILILNIFNKTDWILLKEVIYQIPEIIVDLGENSLIQYIYPTMEMLLTKYMNEYIIIEIIQTVNKLIKLKYIKCHNIAPFFIQIFPFILHPNKRIKNEIINLLETILLNCNTEFFISNIYNSIKNYMTIPPLELTKNSFLSNLKPQLSRVIFLLEFKNIKYEKPNNNECYNILPLFEKIINNQRKQFLSIGNNDNMIYCLPPAEFFSDPIDFRKRTIVSPILKFIKSEINEGEESIGVSLETKIFGKIFWVSDIIENYEFPIFKNNIDFPFEAKNDKIISSSPFKITYLLKALGIKMKLVRLGELLSDKKEENNNNLGIITNFYYNKSFNNWKPKGKIISTLYENNNNNIIKLIQMKNNIFSSFDKNGNVIIYKIINNNKYTLDIKKIWDFDVQNQFPINYKNCIDSLDNFTYITGSKKNLYQYNPQRSPIIKDAINKLCESIDNSNITSLKSFGLSAINNQKIIFCTEGGTINISDQRMNKIALTENVSKQKGLLYSICNIYKEQNFFIGTLDGYLLYYDLRMNSVINEYKYKKNDVPILGMSLYNINKKNIYNINNFKNNNKYLIVWTGEDDHEISFLDYNNFNVDLMLSVNTIDNEEGDNILTIEIPKVKVSNNNFYYLNNSFNKELITNIENLSSLTKKYNNNLIFSQLKEEYYLKQYRNFYKISNIYENISTVQCVLSTYSDCQENIYFNTPYIISAGNDMLIRYWNFGKEKKNNNKVDMSDINSYIINAPNNLSSCYFSKTKFYETEIIQSNEEYNSKVKKKNMKSISEFQNFNGTQYHSITHNEFDENDDLRFCTKIADASHRDIITDLLPINLNDGDSDNNILVSSSMDGTIKLWK